MTAQSEERLASSDTSQSIIGFRGAQGACPLVPLARFAAIRDRTLYLHPQAIELGRIKSGRHLQGAKCQSRFGGSLIEQTSGANITLLQVAVATGDQPFGFLFRLGRQGRRRRYDAAG